MDERIIKYFQGELSKKQRVELLLEREHNEQLKQQFSEYQNIYAILSLSPESIDVQSGERKLYQFSKARRKTKQIRILKMAMGYAAAVCLIIIATWKITDIYRKTEEITIAQQELFVPAGQRARITLPDGTSVWLNAGSTLLYPSVFGDERVVKLSGEAYFDVAVDAHKPFVVSVKDINIKALGTQFNVFCYPKSEYISTFLKHGKVRVYEQGAESDGIILQPDQELFYKNGEFRVENRESSDALLWRDGIYSFRKEKLEVILKKLELYFDVEIIVKDSSILNKEYTGKFRQREGVMEILNILRKIHPFSIEKNEEKNQIILRK